ncbi:hypothetical protein PAPYR_12940 [Paratrimastix pyriformis]|uniref:Uncharacterized protein n=1 Tax=Paratrimastix pyriformis TaxID=342808 RepID=A0ABQ8U4N0_9EUKA|nr:hypothetical protein PAPYR_12940 [Paratrimastix pyriformis]
MSRGGVNRFERFPLPLRRAAPTMIALTLLLHALDETLAEVNASLASGDGLTLRAIPGMVGESLIPTLVAQSQVGLLCSAALETAMMDGPAFRVGD